MRAAFGVPPLTRPTVVALAAAVASTLAERAAAGESPRVVLGGDTRESTPEICRWLAAGLTAGGVDLHHAGGVPTPRGGRVAEKRGPAAGVFFSASHNPYPDNGIKLIDPQGQKWSDEA